MYPMQYLGRTYADNYFILYQKVIHCMSEMQISLGILYFYLLALVILIIEQLEKGLFFSAHFGQVETWIPVALKVAIAP